MRHAIQTMLFVVIALVLLSLAPVAGASKGEVYTPDEMKQIIEAAVKRGFMVGLEVKVKGCAASL